MRNLAIAVPKYAPDVNKNEVIAVWFDALRDIHPEGFKIAYTAIVRSCEEFPSIAHIREVAEGLMPAHIKNLRLRSDNDFPLLSPSKDGIQPASNVQEILKGLEGLRRELREKNKEKSNARSRKG